MEEAKNPAPQEEAGIDPSAMQGGFMGQFAQSATSEGEGEGDLMREFFEIFSSAMGASARRGEDRPAPHKRGLDESE